MDSLFSGDSVASVAIHEDEKDDIAILNCGIQKGLPGLEICRDEPPSVGTRVWVVGSPSGLKNTLSDGLVSGYRSISDVDRWIQITAPISPGSSGGPVVNKKGQVIGIATAKRVGAENVNFAVPASAIVKLLCAVPVNRYIPRGRSLKVECEVMWSSLREYAGQAPDDRQAQLILSAYTQSQEGQYESALKTINEAINAPYCKYEFLLYYLVSDTRQRQYADEIPASQAYSLSTSIEYAKASIKRNPYFAPAYAVLAKDLLVRSQVIPKTIIDEPLSKEEIEDLKDAINAANKLVGLRPYAWEAYSVRSDVLRWQGRNEKAAEDLEKSISLDPMQNKVLIDASILYRRTGELGKAVELSKQALSIAEGAQYTKIFILS